MRWGGRACSSCPLFSVLGLDRRVLAVEIKEGRSAAGVQSSLNSDIELR